MIRGVEERTDYERLLPAVVGDLDARGPVETLLAERIAQLFWRLRRVLRFETEMLSQWQDALIPEPGLLAIRTDRVERAHRIANAIGELFLAGKRVLDYDIALAIREGFVEYLGEKETEFLKIRRNNRLALWLAGEPSKTYTVGELRKIFDTAEQRLQEMPRSSRRFRGTEEGNIISRVYAFWIGSGRQWRLTSAQADRGRTRQQTEGLLLQGERMSIVDRYEPRLRRDLSRTLKDLRDLQMSRRAPMWDELGGEGSEACFSQNEPIALVGT